MDEIRVLSLNTWGLKYVSQHRQVRLAAIAERLARDAHRYDIVALQEVWVESDYVTLSTLTKPYFAYQKLSYSGMLTGPGLLILSKWPIVDSFLYRFPLNGRPSAFFRGDWYVGKAVASTSIAHPSGTVIEVLNAHMHAPYGLGDAAYTCHRTAQAWDMARLAARATKCGHLVVVVGDLNSRPDSLTHRLFESVGGLSDAWVDRHGKFDGDIAQLTTLEQIKLAGTTCDSLLNTWRADRQHHEACRLDYIFYDSKLAFVTDARVAWTEQIAGVGSYSDHFAIEVDLKLRPSPIKSSNTLIPASLFEDILMLIEEYRPTSQWQAKWRNAHFLITIPVLVGLLISVFWAARHNRPWAAFIFLFFTILVVFTGLLDGLMGFLFGRNEWRALKEFESQVELVQVTQLHFNQSPSEASSFRSIK
ncbi:DNase I-like protein [Nadsonia fulvescens var. elongata DSM 6958]|uniref:DNase I-like protein n=1 Tax=Nadsonia fulvescens var. elongata DSM 6958 TaxID=857566 RepID=A0A1E3PNA9_9ASCO|nr:DNase I-like protein [Nadsonia fulvescens var. elongata DSM 6958]